MPCRARPNRVWYCSAAMPILAWSLSFNVAADGLDHQLDLAALMELLTGVRWVDLAYQETVQSGLIDIPLSTRGQLVYEAPDRIRRISDSGDGFALDGDRMQLISHGRVARELVVTDIKPLAAMVDALRATFAGDLTALREHYRLDYQADGARWILDLAPLTSAVSSLIQRIRISGDGATIQVIETLERSGDQRRIRMQVLSREP